jgi:small subunit ribosomal protein S17
MPKKILTGIVISDKPNKTVTVMVERKYSHPVLKTLLKGKINA